ncbi:MAG: nucleoside triphosphate pyrophosphohydrolase [Myxococcales bacterium]|nr:nucleoside triphosphate pyrophosphohydrolase [Myxococcales bacterium]MCB9642022.1 nucleoside triphosphate pyrophosphohydrolase [Myxococcales bacterium]
MRVPLHRQLSRFWLRFRLRVPIATRGFLSNLYSFAQLVSLVKILRGPQGCPWDRAQDIESMLPFLREEALEAIEAAEDRHNNPQAFQKELGDLIFLLCFFADLCEEQGLFSLSSIMSRVVKKMEYRHPHVFGDTATNDPQEISRVWAKRKAQEESYGEDTKPSSVLDGIPKHLPSLHYAQRVGEKVAQVNFDWPSTDEIWDKIHEEIDELKEAMSNQDNKASSAELGDLLFSVAQLSRQLQIDSENALQETCRRFTRRFQYIEEQLHKEGTRPHDTPQEKLELLWKEAKRHLKE